MLSATYIEVKPPALLSPFIESIALRKLAGSLTCLPQGVFHLFCHCEPIHFSPLDNTTHTVAAGSSLLGQQLSSYQLKSDKEQWLMVVSLKPFAFFKQQKISAYEIKNTLQSSKEIFVDNCEFDALMRWLRMLPAQASAIQLQQGVSIILPWLKRQFIDTDFIINSKLRAQTNAVLLCRGDIQINEICSQFDVSKVTLRDHFMANLGLLPKELCKVWRLNNFVLHAYNRKSHLIDAALDVGYYDQAHLNREFKSVCGLPPKTYFKAHPDYTLGHVCDVIQRRFTGVYDPFI
ncbi:helix-turn-helix domain-containing protein [Pseudoalteromonas sp. SSDWG2]|uniref:helix-turn-helix domain-containing protein n=1 Tax=Pseudoalteromonas sp. SSDWG2 TaxID=3139391 RepID=UPI003BA9C72A